MIRSMPVTVDAASWGGRQPPSGWTSGTEQFNIPEVLLTIGIVTAPPRASGFTLAEYWAWVRYISAISPHPVLSLQESFHKLDPHQKTILSDDFGMGFSVYWLWKKMGFSFICDGRYFVDHFLDHYRGAQPLRRPGTRGPTKCPDFVLWQPAGPFHVVECKGTQSGAHTHRSQVSAAKVQKKTIRFDGRQGEQLVSAMTIGFEGGRRRSGLHISDPEAKSVLDVPEKDLGFAEDAIWRGLTSRLLAATGMPATASLLAEPATFVAPKASKKRREDVEKFDALRKERSAEELRGKKANVTVSRDGNRYIFKENTYELPYPIDSGVRAVRKIRVRQEFNEAIADDLRPSEFDDLTVREYISEYQQRDGANLYDSGTSTSVVRIGNAYRAEMELA